MEVVEDLESLYESGQRQEDVGDPSASFNDYSEMVSVAEGLKEGEVDSRIKVLWSTALNSIAGLYLDEGKKHLQDARDHFEKAVQVWEGNDMAKLNLANLEREYGDFKEALEMYLAIADQEVDLDSFKGWEEVWIARAKRQCLSLASYNVALMLHQLGELDRATKYLQRFGYKYRISRNVWDCLSPEDKSEDTMESVKTKSGEMIQLFEGAVPQDLHEHLLKAFSPDSPFWEGTDYKERGYFSFWFPFASRDPSNLVEKLIVDHLLPLTGRKDIVGAEWWVHTRPAGRNMGHQLHFDMEENTLTLHGQVVHPIVSSVVYLSGAQFQGGPTVVFDQHVDDEEFCKDAYITKPVDGAFLTFPGRCLHGVLPGRPTLQPKRKRSPTLETNHPHRLTLLIGFWDRDIAKTGKRERLGPCSPFPRATRSCTWPDVLAIPADLKEEEDEAKPSSKPLLPVRHRTPAWETMDVESPYLETPMAIDQRFFVHSIKQFNPRVTEEDTTTPQENK